MDFSTLKKPNKSFLTEMEQAKKDAVKVSIPSEKGKKSPKLSSEKTKNGRPTIGDEPIAKRTSLGFTSTEFDNLKANAGRIPVAAFIRDILYAAGAFAEKK